MYLQIFASLLFLFVPLNKWYSIIPTLLSILTCFKAFKVYGYTFRGSNSASFIFASLLNKGQLSKERICSSGSQFFLLRVNMFGEEIWGRVVSSREANRNSQKLFPFVKNG